MREKQTVIQDYRRQKERVLKALFVPTKKDPVLASDVDCNDIIQAEKWTEKMSGCCARS